MKVIIRDDKLHIEIDLQKPSPSRSGKTLVVATTSGIVQTDCMINRKPVKIGLNAFIAKD